MDTVCFLRWDVDVVGRPGEGFRSLHPGYRVSPQFLLQFEEENAINSRPFELPGRAQTRNSPTDYDRIERFSLHRGEGSPGLLAAQQMAGNGRRVVDLARDVESAGEGWPNGTKGESAAGREETQESSAR